ncbi:hypothetical protein PVAP13_2KG493705 [Panicum virgatum]|uniref:Uncharacterized protein n=1 Tax=Panicum virgatum TaxID=38727 RepID=A0A8T0WSN0_PANVG|nr:hypothetical protein PVAP13_2KG493705 [Panicum virgatum]
MAARPAHRALAAHRSATAHLVRGGQRWRRAGGMLHSAAPERGPEAAAAEGGARLGRARTRGGGGQGERRRGRADTRGQVEAAAATRGAPGRGRAGARGGRGGRRPSRALAGVGGGRSEGGTEAHAGRRQVPCVWRILGEGGAARVGWRN